MQLLFAVILCTALLACFASAQEDNVPAGTSELRSALSTLHQSAEKLNLENDYLTRKDKSIRDEISQLQMQLERLQAQGEDLDKKTARLQEQSPRRAQEIFRLEEENADWVRRIQKAEMGIQMVQQSLDAWDRENQKPASSPVVSAGSQEAQRRQKEKLKLMKMVYDSQQRQEALDESIRQFQKNAPLQPVADALERQQTLEGQLKDLEAEVAAYPPQGPSVKASSSNQWDDTQLLQLEGELKALERNYAQLKNLMDLMSKKAQGTVTPVSQRVEGDKLLGSIEDLGRQGQGLRADLDDLRSQMVDLDKRKTRLELMIKQLPN